MTSPLTRRTVLAGSAVAGVALVAGCSPAADSSTASPAGPADAPAGAAATPLAQLADLPMGTAVTATAGGAPVLLVRTGESTVSAFSAICPHSGCTVPGGREALVCPCHGSTFGLDGSLVNGPARKGLAKVPVTVVDGEVRTA